MKRLILGVAIASALGLSGCSEDSSNEAKDNVETLIPFSQVVFDPAAGDVPLPNDLLFNGTLDGTLAIPGEDGIDYVDPSLALGALDGWSTSSPISLSVDLATDSDGAMLTLDEASVSQPGAVRLFEATVGGALSSDPECSDAPSVSACKVGDELQFGVDFVALASGNKIAIVPLKPLKANQSYIYATTTLVQDSAGRAVEPSSTYNLLKLDIDTKPLETPDQLFLQGLVNSYEKGLAAEHGVDAETISYSGLFTTQSVADVYETSKLLMAGDPNYQPSFVQLPTPAGYTVAQAAGLTPEDGAAFVVSDLADVYTATIQLPFYGNCSSVTCDFPIVDGVPSAPNGRWFAKGDSPVSVLLALQSGTMSQANFGQQAVAQGVDPVAALQNPALMAGKTWLLDADADGNRADADPTKHLTKFNPIPELMRMETVPVLIALPNAAKVAAFQASQGSTFTPPSNGWPTNIALHGLGGGKEMALAYAGSYAALGIATIAIDMPLHGARSYGDDGTGSYIISASDPSYGKVIGQPDAFKYGNPLVFVNIASTLTVRDNFRQATMDHLALRLLLTGLYTTIAGAEGQLGPQVFDISKISAQGLSLGGIVGTTVSTYASTGLVNPTDGSALPNAYAINAASLVAPSGGLAGSFAGSATFGPVLFDTVTATDDFMDLVDEANVGDFEPGTPEYAALVQAVYAEFIPTFAFAVQTAVDSADPINHASMLADTQLPVHLIEVVGDGAGNLSDRVLPNQVEGFPLSGTEPLIAAMGLDCVSSNNAGSGAVRFSKGHHSSIVSPAEIDGVTDGMAGAATVEMQTQVAGFAKSAGQGEAYILVNNDEVLQECN
ncbi:VolA/Pla-1 family phospholipase [Shewanella sp. 10N.286.48.B5]|uniref:VolA/Pla-1 family phospholipase n=1 Tax=Shewanella sp. 10N.286.48.B5 TaxID=1880834 RepID=UPI000C8298AD|nr:VolA/Pla-1 family phospholipase [Shewanella sp. 10N.286.48.B5]PMH84486.1 lipase [Shewanella sp. 10N.286.48.B5]